MEQVFDSLSSVGGTVTFPPSGYYDTSGLSALIVEVEAATATAGTVTSSIRRDDGSVSNLKSAAGPAAAAADWSWSVGDLTPGFTIPACPKNYKIVAVAGGGGTIRVTVWAVKLEG
jgi:hypothetical protein